MLQFLDNLEVEVELPNNCEGKMSKSKVTFQLLI